MQAETITAFPSEDNVSSVALLEKANFIRPPNSFHHTHAQVNNLVTYILEKNCVNEHASRTFG